MRFSAGSQLLTLLGALAMAGCPSGGDDDGDGDGDGTSGDRAMTILGLTGDATAGEMVFSDNACSVVGCHGPDGTVDNPLGPLVMAASDEQIVDTFLNGKGSMPAQSSLSDQELADVLAWLNANFG